MKTFQQFNEDIKQRTMQLRQRHLEQGQAEKERVASYHSAQKKKKEREELKKEIKRELKRDR
jgi:hypothetical protein